MFCDSVSQSATCFLYINDMTSFAYNAIHIVLQIQVNVSVTLQDSLGPFMRVAEQLVTN